MSRFQALTNTPLDQELEMVRQRLGLEPNQKADLLREITALAAWVIRQAERGCIVEARLGEKVEPLVHPVIERLHVQQDRPLNTRVILSHAEATRLAEILSRGFDPPPALRASLASLINPKRQPPKLHWKK